MASGTGAWSNKAKAGNLKQYAETVNYLMENNLYTVEDLEAYASGLYQKMDKMRERINQAQSRSKEITDLLSFAEMNAETKSVFDQLNGIKFKKRREKFKAEHENELRRFYLARRKLKDHFTEDGKLPISAWRRELAELEQTVSGIKAEHSPLREEWKKLSQIKTCVSNTLRQMEQSPRQKQHNHDVHL